MTWPTLTAGATVYAQRDPTRAKCYEIPADKLALHFSRKPTEEMKEKAKPSVMTTATTSAPQPQHFQVRGCGGMGYSGC